MDFFSHKKIYDFIGMSKYGFALSGFLIILIIIFFFKNGLTLGIDFVGGTIAQVQYGKVAPLEEIKEALNKTNTFKDASITTFGGDSEVVIRFSFQSDSKFSVSDELTRALKDTGEFEIRRMDSIGPKSGSELAKNGIISVSLAIIAMMLYISFRYEWRFALAGTLALVHDAVISAGAIVFFNIDLSLDVIAALLTLIGYSINDTIIIFDRIREQMLARKFNDVKYVINEAVSITLSRTVLTSLSVFLVIAILYFFGSEALKGFSAPMLIGSIVGTYSSMIIAPKLAIMLGFSMQEYYAKEEKKRIKKAKKEEMRKMYERGRF